MRPPQSTRPLMLPSSPQPRSKTIKRYRLDYGTQNMRSLDRRADVLPWSTLFHGLVEKALQEAEDMMLSLPYTQIRAQVGHFAHYLPTQIVHSAEHHNQAKSTHPIDPLLRDITRSVQSRTATASGKGSEHERTSDSRRNGHSVDVKATLYVLVCPM